MRSAWAWMAAAVALIALLSWIGCGGEETRTSAPDPLAVALPDTAAVRAFNGAVQQGYEALEAGNLEEALGHFRRLAEIVPASPYADYHVACAYGRVGRADEALRALDRSVAKGMVDRHQLLEDPDLSSLQTHAGWAELMAVVDREALAQTERLAGALGAADPTTAVAFSDLDTLRVHYQQQMRAVFPPAQLFARAVGLVHVGRITGRQLASLERFKRDHPEQGYAADMSALRAVTGLTRMQDPWIVGREEAVALAGQIRAAYPDSAGALEAAVWEAKAAIQGLHDPRGEIAAAAAATAVDRLLTVADLCRGTEWEAEALGEAIWYQDRATGRDAALLRPLIDRLRGLEPASLRGLQRAYEINEIVLLAGGAPEFTATDLDERVWTLDALRGKVALLDFWATWCGPCRQEIPLLVELSETYKPEEFMILGISLDTFAKMPVDSFRAWLTESGMTWPQIYEGAGWESVLAAHYGIPAIPFPVLLDAQGRVVAAGPGARGEDLRRKVKELVGH